MATIVVHCGDAPEIEAFLAQRIYEYNAVATGYNDAESFTAVRKDGSGAVEAGISGYTWGGCCYVSYLWVSTALRGKGLGSELLGAVERHARGKRCVLVLLASHSFQAPEFYARRGYALVARVDDHPVGHSSIFYTKRLDAARTNALSGVTSHQRNQERVKHSHHEDTPYDCRNSESHGL